MALPVDQTMDVNLHDTDFITVQEFDLSGGLSGSNSNSGRHVPHASTACTRCQGAHRKCERTAPGPCKRCQELQLKHPDDDIQCLFTGDGRKRAARLQSDGGETDETAGMMPTGTTDARGIQNPEEPTNRALEPRSLGTDVLTSFNLLAECIRVLSQQLIATQELPFDREAFLRCLSDRFEALRLEVESIAFVLVFLVSGRL